MKDAFNEVRYQICVKAIRVEISWIGCDLSSDDGIDNQILIFDSQALAEAHVISLIRLLLVLYYCTMISESNFLLGKVKQATGI